MTGAQTSEGVFTKLLKVKERAKQEPEGRFNSLAHLLDRTMLLGAYRELKPNAAVGVDGVSVEEYGKELSKNIDDLHERLKTQRYRHQPIRRVYIPKEGGKVRPLGISTTEDKLVQRGVKEVLETVYEQDFLDCSYGFRPGRSAHDLLRAMNAAVGEGAVNWILEADFECYFDSIDRKKLQELLARRVADSSLLRLVGKCLHVGVLDGEEYTEPERGAAQGSILSPLLGNIYLHYVLDEWFEREVKPRLKGKAYLWRYADDMVMGFEREEDARRMWEVLPKRVEKYGLTLHPEKTRLLPFRRPTGTDTKGPSSFDFLGFTMYWNRTRNGAWRPALKTRKARLRRAITAVGEWCRENRHKPVKEQRLSLVRRLVGHMNYFGVNGNMYSLSQFLFQARRQWFKWLNRRSQRASLTWERFNQVTKTYPLPLPRVCVQIWGRTP